MNLEADSKMVDELSEPKVNLKVTKAGMVVALTVLKGGDVTFY